MEEKKKKKRALQYIQQLQNEVLEREATLLEEAEESQIARSKCKKIVTRDEEGQWLFKKAKGR